MGKSIFIKDAKVLTLFNKDGFNHPFATSKVGFGSVNETQHLLNEHYP
jgi:hypothetical protein